MPINRNPEVLLLSASSDSERELARLLFLTLEEEGIAVSSADISGFFDDEDTAIPGEGAFSATLPGDGLPPFGGNALMIAVLHDCDGDLAARLFQKGVRFLCCFDFEGDLPDGMVLFLRPFSYTLFHSRLMPVGSGETAAGTAYAGDDGQKKPFLTVSDGCLFLGDCPGIPLTDAEERLLGRLIADRGCPVSRDALFDAIKGSHAASPRMVDAYIRRLRQKMASVTDRRLIDTVRGQGYCLRTKGTHDAKMSE